MNWVIQSYVTDTGYYFITRRGQNDWIAVLSGDATVYDGFTIEGDAMAFCEQNNQNNQPPVPQVFTPVIVPIAEDALFDPTLVYQAGDTATLIDGSVWLAVTPVNGEYPGLVPGNWTMTTPPGFAPPIPLERRAASL